MKKIFFLIVLLSGTTLFSTVNAQVTINPQFGVLFSNYSGGPEDIDVDRGSGFQVGVNLRLTITENLYFQPGALIQRTGVDFSGNTNGFSGDDEINTTSIKIPAYLGFYLGKVGPLNMRAYGGFAGKYLTGVKDNDFDLDSDQFKNLNWSFNAGIGADLFIITLDAEYDLGLSPSLENIDDSKPRMLILSVGIKL